jgi:hypothetical protein
LKRRGAFMGSLKDELLKSKVVSKKDVKRSDHEDRVRKKEVGREEVRKEKEKFSQEIVAKKEEKKKKDRGREEVKRSEKEGKEKVLRLERKVRENAVPQAFFKAKRYHFLAGNGGLPYLEVSDENARRLELGKLAVIEIPQEKCSEFFIVPEGIAREVRSALTDWVRVFNN